MVDRAQAWQYSGAFAVAVTLLGVLSATLVSPAFRWQENALSNMGVTATAAGTPTTVFLFNGGLIVGGLFGLLFAGYLLRVAGEKALGGAFAVTVLLMGLVGVFPQDGPAHFPVAAGFYLFITLTLWLDSLLWFRGGWRERAAVSVFLGTVNLAGLVVWVVTGPVTRPGLAIPEIVGALAFATWTALVSLDRIPGRPGATDGDL